jgi:hypothetical protein
MVIDALKPLFANHESIIEFREQELWTRDVNLTLDANKKSIIKLYNHCARGKTHRLTM